MLIHKKLRNTELVTKDGKVRVDSKGVITGLDKRLEKGYKDAVDIDYIEDKIEKVAPKVENAVKEEKSEEPKPRTRRTRKTTAKKEE